MRRPWLPILAFVFVSSLAAAQVPIRPEGFSYVNNLFDSRPEATLACSIHEARPFLDFMFRYNAGFLISSRLNQFAPGEPLVVYVRVSPLHGSAMLLGEILQVPVAPPDMAKHASAKDLSKLEISTSGGFWIGEGDYKVEVMLLDRHLRSCRKHWSLKTARRAPNAGPLAVKPNTVEPAQAQAWDGKLEKGGVRLTVLLHAAPIFPLSPKLHAWDRAFLLQSLTSLLKQLPCQSVRVIAFNLDQHHEIFREDQFDAEAFNRLEEKLRELELSTVSVQALQRQNWPELLVRLAQEEAAARDPSEAVVFLGPTSHFSNKVPHDTTQAMEGGPPRFFYVEYFPFTGADFGDSIDSLTRDLHGTVYRIHSADQLSHAIQRMLGQIRP